MSMALISDWLGKKLAGIVLIRPLVKLIRCRLAATSLFLARLVVSLAPREELFKLIRGPHMLMLRFFRKGVFLRSDRLIATTRY